MNINKKTNQRSTSTSTSTSATTTKTSLLNSELPMRLPRPKNNFALKRVEDTGKILKYIDDNIIGKGSPFLGPFGRRKVVYADYSSSGHSLQFIEDYIIKEILPLNGDLSCTSSVTGLQSQLYFKEAKELVRSTVNATNDDEIIFCEYTCTSPVERIISLICLQDSNNSNNDNELNEYMENPILFVSTSEPDKNLLPWIDAGVQIEKIPKNRDGYLDLVDLEKKLASFLECRRKLIGLFSAASRVSGILADDVATTILLHQYGAISIFDYSLSASSSVIDINPVLQGASKDIIFFSGNKFIGGVQAPGVLIVKKSLLKQKCQYVYDNVGAIDAIRVGLAIQLKEAIGIQAITNEHEKLCKTMLSHIRTIPEIVLLGPSSTTTKRIPTVCFLVRQSRSTYLHHRFVVAILNDVFGIQATAINNIVEAMGISKKMIVDYERLLADDSIDIESIRPGYIQITIPYFMTEIELSFILEALKMVATEAWKLLPQYDVDNRTGEWKHISNAMIKERKCLSAIRYVDGRMHFGDRKMSGPGFFPQNYADCLQTARNIFNRARKMAQRTPLSDNKIALKLSKHSAENLRWYMLPGEAHELLLGHSHNVKQMLPFDPTNSHEPPSLLNMHRHNSLSALDVKLFKSRSMPTSPVHLSITRQQSTPSPTRIPETEAIDGNGLGTTSIVRPMVRFSLGGEVTTIPNLNATRLLTGIEPTITPNRNSFNSITSEADDIEAYVKEVTNELATEIKSELREVISQVEDVLENTDGLVDISLYNLSSLNNVNSADELRNDSVSAAEVAEYLKEYSIEMTNEVKSEIREVVNGMNEIDSNQLLDIDHGLTNIRKCCSSSHTDISDLSLSIQSVLTENDNMETSPNPQHRHSDIIIQNSAAPECNDINKQRSESYPQTSNTNTIIKHTCKYITAKNPESSTPSCPYTGTISKLIDSIGTISQDSGINMNDHELDEGLLKVKTSIIENENRFLHSQLPDYNYSSSSDGKNYFKSKNQLINTPTTNLSTTKNQNQLPKDNFECNNNLLKRDSTDSNVSSTGPDNTTEHTEEYKWQHLPNTVWKQTAEAIDEYDMLKDGDRILICLSGSSSSLCLLHSLRQFSRARDIHIEMAAITIGDSGVDPRALMLYLRDLDIKYYVEKLGPSENILKKLYKFAKNKNYNVLAMGNTLDKLADEFLDGLLHKGRLRPSPAHFHNTDENLRIIRPFVYLRERNLEDFAIQKNLPTRPSKLFTRPPDAQNSILKVQEIINPNVYDSIKNALRPLLSLRIEATKTSYDYLKLSSYGRD